MPNRISTDFRFDVGVFDPPALELLGVAATPALVGVTGTNTLSRVKRPLIFFLPVTVNGAANFSGHLNTEFLPPATTALGVSARTGVAGTTDGDGVHNGSAATAARAGVAEPGEESSESEESLLVESFSSLRSIVVLPMSSIVRPRLKTRRLEKDVDCPGDRDEVGRSMRVGETPELLRPDAVLGLAAAGSVSISRVSRL
jgi:hypothetical protein